MDQDQTDPTLFDQEASETFQQMTKVKDICRGWHFKCDLDLVGVRRWRFKCSPNLVGVKKKVVSSIWLNFVRNL